VVGGTWATLPKRVDVGKLLHRFIGALRRRAGECAPYLPESRALARKVRWIDQRLRVER
jgi:hypothetical protein